VVDLGGVLVTYDPTLYCPYADEVEYIVCVDISCMTLYIFANVNFNFLYFEVERGPYIWKTIT